ncbi:MAG TPA: sulfatase [Ideonella sp.]|jgi:arylsulfatase A-like enzyme|nr:sulfatase [Ideonella sp.]
MRRLLRLMAITVASLHVACGGGSSGNSVPPPPGGQAPNIILILTDDQAAQDVAQMPLLKSLITDEGATFRQHFVSLSLCCPSRVSGLRGQFAHNTTIFKNNPPEGGFEGTYAKGLESSTVATWLRGAGYRTALFGKYLNGYPSTAPNNYIPPGWTEWYSPNGGNPYKEFDYSLNENGSTVSYGSTAADYLTDVLSNKAADFIRRSVDQYPTQPFFAYIATYAPHAPATPAPRHENAFPGVQAPRTAAFNEADVSDKPAWIQALPLLNQTQIDDIDKLYRHRLQSLLAVDELIQNIVNTLQAKGQLANTYILFASDNGYHQGLHRLDSGKMTAFEEDLLVPLMVRGPGVPRGSSVSFLTANVDYAPTFAEIAGASAPGFVDGRSLLGLMKGQSPTDWRQMLLLEHKLDADDHLVPLDGTREPPDAFERRMRDAGVGITAFSGLRTADGKTYVEYDTGEYELYDNLTDPSQLKNGYNTAPSDLKTRLSGWLGTLRTASGTSLRQAESSR